MSNLRICCCCLWGLSFFVGVVSILRNLLVVVAAAVAAAVLNVVTPQSFPLIPRLPSVLRFKLSKAKKARNHEINKAYSALKKAAKA